GQGDLAHAEARGLHGRLAIAHVAVDVLHHHDAIVHQAAQGQDQREEHHHVQRYAEEVEQGEGDEHAQGDGEAYEEGIAQAQEEHEHAHHEDHPEDDVVEQLAHAQAGVLALVTGDGDDEVLGQHAAVVLGDDGVDAVAGIEQVLAGALDHVEHHHALAELAGEALWFLEGEVHRGDIAQAHLALVLVLHHDVAHLLHVVELAHHAHAAALVLG